MGKPARLLFGRWACIPPHFASCFVQHPVNISQQVASYNLTKLIRDNIIKIEQQNGENRYYIDYEVPESLQHQIQDRNSDQSPPFFARAVNDAPNTVAIKSTHTNITYIFLISFTLLFLFFFREKAYASQA